MVSTFIAFNSVSCTFLPNPVEAMIGRFGAIVRRARTQATPSMCGIIRSVSTAAMLAEFMTNTASASVPSAAVSTR